MVQLMIEITQIEDGSVNTKIFSKSEKNHAEIEKQFCDHIVGIIRNYLEQKSESGDNHG